MLERALIHITRDVEEMSRNAATQDAMLEIVRARVAKLEIEVAELKRNLIPGGGFPKHKPSDKDQPLKP